MIQNMGTIDRIVRTVIALAIIGAFFFDFIVGTVAFVLLGLAVIFLGTVSVGSCPLYIPFKISTKK